MFICQRSAGSVRCPRPPRKKILGKASTVRSLSFNDTIDTYALKPLAQGYQYVTPQFLEDGVRNMFRNIGDVGNLANNVLQSQAGRGRGRHCSG